MPLGRKVRYGMVGGGPGAFIGAVHRKAAALDGEIELVAGAFSSSSEKSKQQGEELKLDASRVYGSYKEMADAERQLPAGERIDFVSIVTPNFTHYDIAKTFIEAGFHVVCDKPMTMTVEEAEDLCRLVEKHNTIFALTHNYTGYPMVKQARELVQGGKLGKVRKIVVEYPQGWLATHLEAEGAKQAVWRTDPKQAGVSSAIGDIGSHAENLARYITGLEIEKICADLTTFVPGRLLEDDANMLLHMEDGVKAVLYCSQISVGEENNLRIRVYGTEASLEWHQEHPNYLYVRYPDGPEKVYKRGNDYLADVAKHNTRLPFGHPEAFIEAFANIYVNAARTIAARLAGEDPGPFDTDFPTVQDGAIGVHFIHTAVKSGKEEGWVDAKYAPPGS
ncbi:MAG: Gfo/Idh/MocA family oxidoreductase [Rhodothermaceae bacterium]|nr:Gfo/Idh/MocA family oxidoreductase [Rhodothermaceae bacterium]